MWSGVRKVAEHGVLFTAEKTNRISNSGTVSWEGHGSDPIITTDSGPRGSQNGYVFFPEPTVELSAGALSTSLAVWVEHHRSSPLWSSGPRSFSSLPLSVFTYLRLSIQIQQRAGTILLGHRTSVLALIPLLCQCCMLIQLASPPPLYTTTTLSLPARAHFNLV